MMGGRIEVTSAPGAGSTFAFTVRLARAAPAGHAAGAASTSMPAAAARRGRVLIAEDNPVNQKVTARMLDRLGFDAEIAETGEEAVAAARQKRYDVILMDGQMPGLDGFAATAHIRGFEGPVRHTPIVALTASAMRGDRERYLDAGMDDYLAKPITPEQLATVLERWVPAVSAHAPGARPRHEPGPGDPVDWEMVADLVAMTPPDFVDELLTLFFRDSAKALTELRLAWREDDLEAWRRMAHKLRGACATLGARVMMDLCARMEDLDEAGLEESGEPLLDDLEREYVRARDALSDHQRRPARQGARPETA